jgi:hypothetical protein
MPRTALGGHQGNGRARRHWREATFGAPLSRRTAAAQSAADRSLAIA